VVKLGFLLVALVVGLFLQRLRSEERVRDWIWNVSFWLVIPVLVFATFLTVSLTSRLGLAIAAVIASTYLLFGLSHLYARLVTKERDERGALTLAGTVGNTGFIGYPLAQLAFGHSGLTQAVVYDQLSLLNPPLWALIAALSLRAAGVHIPRIGTVENAAAALIGPLGFLMLGVSLPLEQVEHDLIEVARAIGAMALKIGAGPLILFAIGTALGAHIPSTFYLLAAMPPAFHLLTIARVYDMRPALMRLMVVAATIPVVVAVVIGSFVF
jgi:predicted permease